MLRVLTLIRRNFLKIFGILCCAMRNLIRVNAALHRAVESG